MSIVRRFLFLATAVCVMVGNQVRAADLGAIDRSIGKEPAYQSKNPEYCLLVFGLEAKTRVWVVLDGDVLYLDRNGNGNLTDPGERIAPREVLRRPEGRVDVELMRIFELVGWAPPAPPILTCGPEVNWFYLFQLVPRDDYHERDWVKFYQEKPFDFAVTTRTKCAERARLGFGQRPQDAPVLHFDGPRSLSLSERWPMTFRRGEITHLAVELTTPGLNAVVKTDHHEIPPEIHPVAEIAFPPAAPGEEPARLRVELKERC